jgi:hypothetical protein
VPIAIARRCYSSSELDLKETLKEVIPAKRELFKKVKANGSAVIGEVKVENTIGGMRYGAQEHQREIRKLKILTCVVEASRQWCGRVVFWMRMRAFGSMVEPSRTARRNSPRERQAQKCCPRPCSGCS